MRRSPRWRSCSSCVSPPRIGSFPGYGAAAAVLLGLGTLVLPFSTVFFAHVLSATLGMAAFSLLLRHRRGGAGTAAPAIAGVLAGLAIVVEFPLGIVAVALASVRRALTASRPIPLGAIVGILPIPGLQHVGVREPVRALVQQRRDRARRKRDTT